MLSKNWKRIGVALSVFGIVCFLNLILANTYAAAYGKEETTTDAAPAPAMAGMDEAMMAQVKEYSTPNENHKVLEQFVGSWEHSMKWWVSPEPPPEESTGSTEVQWILDGRFIEQTVTGTSMGQPFAGRGITGYDNMKKEYNSIWIDNMSTGMMTAKASYDSATKTFKEKGDFTCPIRNGSVAFRAETKIVDDDTHIYTMYTTDAGGKEFKTMEITYKRKK